MVHKGSTILGHIIKINGYLQCLVGHSHPLPLTSNPRPICICRCMPYNILSDTTMRQNTRADTPKIKLVREAIHKYAVPL